MNNELTVNIILKTSQVDLVIDALKEKKYIIEDLTNQIYDTTKHQIEEYKKIQERESKMQDAVLLCKDCGNPFPFSAKEQKFYTEKGFQVPYRCKKCRKKRAKNKNNKRAVKN